MAARTLQDVMEVDSGFFVCQNDIMTHELTPQKPTVYAPWGVFMKAEGQLQTALDEFMTSIDMLNPMMRKWLPVDTMPTARRLVWESCESVEVGVWPLVLREQMIGLIVVVRTRPGLSHLTFETKATVMEICAAQVSLVLDLVLAVQTAKQESQHDLLTGLLNRRGMEARLPQLIRECEHDAASLVLILVDMDNLKRINDTYGHLAGDKALRKIADLVRRMVRSLDIVARVGGDEFVIVFRSDKPDAGSLIERIENAVCEESKSLTVSVGSAVWKIDGESFEQCYQIADERMYKRKFTRQLARQAQTQHIEVV